MSVIGPIRSGVRAGGLMLRTVAWCVETLWLGVVGLWRGVWFLMHVRQAFSTTLRCPRGHAVEAFGPIRCGRCHATFEGHVFDPCPSPSCGAKARFISCPTCQLAVRNPLR